jgi:hypothetical protein
MTEIAFLPIGRDGKVLRVEMSGFAPGLASLPLAATREVDG